ncbi:hypothetical protein Mal64_11280 [Pseudobythopirellula maris]|uniref:Uncharacterized protein n=1 Tax=Pseudobythopirellula maris TaxID=2527991 RepID=A0A5C5ZWR4_9BACT|nr:hypothetical protein [Pseudobythopirellula maris]TWT90733.1 hypothetical protein Mal64_11280 [Pseudobythopirellula maris]
MENPRQDEDTPAGAREGFNRLAGLGCHAAGVVTLGLLAFSVYEDGFRDAQSLLIGVAVAMVFFGLGYTTGRRG